MIQIRECEIMVDVKKSSNNKENGETPEIDLSDIDITPERHLDMLEIKKLIAEEGDTFEDSARKTLEAEFLAGMIPKEYLDASKKTGMPKLIGEMVKRFSDKNLTYEEFESILNNMEDRFLKEVEFDGEQGRKVSFGDLLRELGKIGKTEDLINDFIKLFESAIDNFQVRNFKVESKSEQGFLLDYSKTLQTNQRVDPDDIIKLIHKYNIPPKNATDLIKEYLEFLQDQHDAADSRDKDTFHIRIVFDERVEEK